jgi:hypothetical protein
MKRRLATIWTGRTAYGSIVQGTIVREEFFEEVLSSGRIVFWKNCSWEELSGKNCLERNSPGRTDNIR